MKTDLLGLIVVDTQHYFVEPQSALLLLVEHLAPGAVKPYVQRVTETAIPAIQCRLSEFRTRKAPIFYTTLGSHHADGSDLPPWAQGINGMCLSILEKPTYPQFDNPSAAIIPALLPQEEEIFLRKKTAGAFSSTNIHTSLQERRVNLVVACGVNTDICVGQTTRELADCGYEVVVVEDGCATTKWIIVLKGNQSKTNLGSCPPNPASTRPSCSCAPTCQRMREKSLLAKYRGEFAGQLRHRWVA